MQICRGLEGLEGCRGGVAAIGNFDGVHLGHRAMIAEAVRMARSLSVPALAVTFDPHPLVILRGSAPPALTTTDRKLELLAECGLDSAVVLNTSRDFLNLSPREFFDRYLIGELQAKGVVEGPNFRFGHDRAGDVETMRRFCAEARLEFSAVPGVVVEGRTVSSSEIRGAIRRGDVAGAAAMLGSPYRLRGRVVEGARRGRTIGFPTANLAEIATLVPPSGVYAGRAQVDGTLYPAGINIGPNPTFADEQQKFEVHLLDFAGDLYGRLLDVDLLGRLRDTRQFAGVDDLKRQLEVDLQQVRQSV